MERYLRVNLLGPGPLSYKKNYLPGRGLTKVGKHWSKQRVTKSVVTKQPTNASRK
jgi:hypothetical protein